MRNTFKLSHVPRGFSLVEALVALVVLAIGMLGIAALYVESLRANRTALFRTQAVNFATDMADRIRANRDARVWYGVAVDDSNINANCETDGSGCTPQVLAQHDKALWLRDLRAELPGGSGTVTWSNATLPETYTITVQWSETGQASPLQIQMSVQI